MFTKNFSEISLFNLRETKRLAILEICGELSIKDKNQLQFFQILSKNYGESNFVDWIGPLRQVQFFAKFPIFSNFLSVEIFS